MAVEGGANYRQMLANRQMKRSAIPKAKAKRELAFSTPAPMEAPTKPKASLFERLSFSPLFNTRLLGGMSEQAAQARNRANIIQQAAENPNLSREDRRNLQISAAMESPEVKGFIEEYGGSGVIGSVARRAAGPLVKTGRGRFESGRKGLKSLSEIITGDPTLGSFVMRRYPNLGRLAREGELSFRGIDVPEETQIPYFRQTAKGGFERASNWLNIPFSDFGRLLDVPEASLNEISVAARGRPFDFGDPTPSVEAVKRAINIRRSDLGPESSSFGFITNPASRYGRSAVTAPKEHVIGAAFTGADTVSNALRYADEVSDVLELTPILDKLEKQGRAALSPNELILVDDFFNSRIKGSGPYEVAREMALGAGDLPFIRQFSDEAATNKAYIDTISRLSKVSETLTDPLRMERFSKTIKPRVKFGSSWGVGEDAFDPSLVRREVREQLAEWLRNM
jgi:hypothetical protein